MVKHCREIVRSGQLGKIRKIIVQYTQGWLAEDAENKGNKQAEWRMDPKKAGVSCTMGDIGVHAANLIEYITELRINEVCADMSSFGKERLLDDDGSLLIRLNNGAKGVLTASQICAGEENNLRIQVFGEYGGIEWHQMEPNTIELKWVNKSKQVIRTGVGDLSEIAHAHTRVPAGHPEGYIEAFANIYRNFARAVHQYNNGKKPDSLYDFPTVYDGIRGMKFIEKTIESGQATQKWVKI
jgi:predicted dehydrogenase